MMTTLKMPPVERTAGTRELVVHTASGAVRGSVVDGVHRFTGIPYAAPPFGPNRLRAPQPVAPWAGVRDALSWGAMPPQLPYPPPWDALIPERGPLGEDCLNLNIWTPDRGSARLPVMVWIPGGMFEAGSGATYDGSHFARHGVVCVTINYRIGAEGFLLLPGGNANRGLLDQLAALEWVRENIGAFGGDPDNVTVFGQSAGAMSVGTLLSMPRAEGLFRRAIAQSGGAHQVIPPETAWKVSRQLAAKLGVQPTRAAIAALPVDRLLRAQAELKADLVAHPDPERWGSDVVLGLLPWQPVVDGDVVPARPLDRIVAGSAANIDLIVGSTADEWNFFLVPPGAIEHITPEAVAGAIAGYGLPVEATLASYRAGHPGASAGELLSAIQGDWCFRIPALRLADAHARSPAATYSYEFAWRSPQFGGRLGACHGLEIGFLFYAIGKETEGLAGPNPPQELAERMRDAWVGFASNGNPGWPRYDLTRRATMRFDTSSGVVNDPMSRERVLWEGVR
jgi:para-nitrobenzyl esterase